jgi:hypothetical protein
LAGDFAESGGIGQPASMGGSAPGKGPACEARWGDPAANGVDRSTSYNTPRLKLPAIGKITYVKRV